MSVHKPAPSTRRQHRVERKSERLDIRVTSSQKALLEDAAAATSRSVSDFVTEAATVAALDALTDRTQFALMAKEWAAFSTALDREPRHLPRLGAFLGSRSVLDPE